jgi:hypothetical protein
MRAGRRPSHRQCQGTTSTVGASGNVKPVIPSRYSISLPRRSFDADRFEGSVPLRPYPSLRGIAPGHLTSQMRHLVLQAEATIIDSGSTPRARSRKMARL